MFRLIFFLGIVKYLSLSSLFHTAMAADIRLSSNFGRESNNLSSSAGSAGLGIEISQSFWSINTIQSGFNLLVGNEVITGQTKSNQRSRIDTIDSIYIQGGFHLKKQQGAGFWTLLAATGPLTARLRINDSTAQSASIYKSQQLNGWQNNLSALYQYPISRNIFLASGISWKQKQVELGERPFSLFEQNFTPTGLTLTEGIDRPDNFSIPRQVRSQAWDFSFGVLFSL